LDPTSTQFQNYFNPYQSFITDEINRQAQMQQNQIANQAVMGGAFGGGREGVQRAELGGRTLSAIGQAQGTAFQQALNAFQQNQSLQTQAGLQGGAQLGQLGTVQQSMAQGDINQLMAGGGLQRQLGQQALDAARQTTLQQQYEPFQRAEFLKIFMQLDLLVNQLLRLLLLREQILLHKQREQDLEHMQLILH
jgi:hypothetical protein